MTAFTNEVYSEGFTMLFDDFYNRFIIEDHTLILPTQRLATGIQIIPLEKGQYADNDLHSDLSSDYDSLFKSLSVLYKSLPIGTVVHLQAIHTGGSPSICEIGEADGFYTKNTKRFFQDRLVGKFQLNMYLCFDTQYKNPTKPHNTTLAKQRYGKKINTDTFEATLKHKSKVIEITKNFCASLNSLKGLKVKLMEKQDLDRVSFEYLNLAFGEGAKTIQNNVSNKTGNIVQIGKHNVSFVRLAEPCDEITTSRRNAKNLPEFLTAPLGTDLNFPHIVNTSILITDTQAELKGIDIKKSLSRDSGSLTSQKNREQSNQLDEYTKEARKTDSTQVRVAVNVMLWDADISRLEESINLTRAGFNSMNNSIGMVEELDTLNLFFSYAPGMANDMINGFLMPIDQGVCFQDFSFETVTESTGIIVCNRKQEPVFLDLRHSSLDNKNAIVIGPSGSGKSFFCNNWITQDFERGFDQTIIDVGGSYEKIVKVLGGAYHKWDPENPFSLNVLSIYRGNDGLFDLSDDKVKFFRSLISALWKDSNQNEYLSRTEGSIMVDLLNLYIAHANRITDVNYSVCLSDFVNFVGHYLETGNNKTSKIERELGLVNMDEFLLNMKQFTTGTYGKALNNKTSLDLSKDNMICFDMLGIAENPILYPVITLVIVELVLDKMRQNVHTPKNLFMDEAWSFLTRSAQMAEFTETIFRTCRKQNGSGVVITQGVTELESAKVGRAIVNNTAIKILLDHSSQTAQYPAIQSFLGFDSHDLEQLSSIRRDPNGKWREFLVKRQRSQVYSLETSPHSYAAYTTAPAEKARINELLAKYKRMDFAINAFVEEKQNNLAA